MGGGLNFKVENTAFDIKVKCTACNNEHPLHAQRMMKQGGSSAAGRLRHGWRLALGRFPEAGELAILLRGLERNLSVYKDDREEARKLLESGESERDEELPLAEHAAYTLAAQTILNLDELINLE